MISSEEFKKLLDFAFDAYQHHNTSGQAYRQDGNVPYMTHPLWCSLMLLADTRIPREERERGAKALILHDILEDTDLPLPEWVPKDVADLVKEMTFENSEHALREAASKPIHVKLLLLVDGLSSMYEEHVSPQRRARWKAAVMQATEEVEEHYGNIRIVQVAKSIAENTKWERVSG